MMKLSEWAKKQGICYKTAWRWFKRGYLHGLQLPNGTIIVDETVDNGFKEKKK